MLHIDRTLLGALLLLACGSKPPEIQTHGSGIAGASAAHAAAAGAHARERAVELYIDRGAPDGPEHYVGWIDADGVSPERGDDALVLRSVRTGRELSILHRVTARCD